MSATATASRHGRSEETRSWLPMVALFLAQVLMSFNVAALPVSLGGMVEDFGVPPTAVSTAIVVYGLVVAALVMTGAKIGQRVGWVRMFRIARSWGGVRSSGSCWSSPSPSSGSARPCARTAATTRCASTASPPPSSGPRYPPRVIGVFGFSLTTAALVWLAFVVTNNWETLPTIAGLVVFGVGQGALVTLVFNVLVTAAPTSLAGDVGSIRGTTQNLASAVGTAVAGDLLVTILSVSVARSALDHDELPPELVSRIDLDNVNFVSNDDLRTVLGGVDATPAEIEAAVAVNEESRLRALRLGLLVLAGVSATAILPAGRLPRYRPGEIPDPSA